MKKLMKKGTILFATLLICLTLVLTAGSAQALTWSQAEAQIDWNFTVTGDIALIWDAPLGSKMSGSEASATDGFTPSSNSSNTSDWNVGSNSASVTGANAEGRATSSTNYSGQVYEKTYAQGATGASSSANAWQYGFFHVLGTTPDPQGGYTGDGTVTFNVTYSLDQDMHADLFEWAYANSYAEFKFTKNPTQNPTTLGDVWTLEKEVQNWDQWDKEVTDTFSYPLYFDFDAGDKGEFFALVSNTSTSAVPEPATVLLLGSGLIGMSLIGRRKLLKG